MGGHMPVRPDFISPTQIDTIAQASNSQRVATTRALIQADIPSTMANR